MTERIYLIFQLYLNKTINTLKLCLKKFSVLVVYTVTVAHGLKV